MSVTLRSTILQGSCATITLHPPFNISMCRECRNRTALDVPKTPVLKPSHSILEIKAGITGFEPVPRGVTSLHCNHSTILPNFSCGGRTRTSDLQVMSLRSYQLLYPTILLDLRRHSRIEPRSLGYKARIITIIL